MLYIITAAMKWGQLQTLLNIKAVDIAESRLWYEDTTPQMYSTYQKCCSKLSTA